MLVWELHAGVSSEAAVDGQDNAGDSGSEVVVGQEQHAAQQLVGINKAAHGVPAMILAERAVGVPSGLNSRALF